MDYRVEAIYYVGEDENLLCRSVILEIKESFEEISKSFERIKKEFEEVE